MLRRAGRREEAPSEAAGEVADGPSRYRMREQVIAIGDDYWIEDGRGNRAFHVDGKALRVRDTLNFDDLNGQTRYRIQQRVARVRDTMEIEHAGGGTAATIKKALITPLRERYAISIPGQPDWDAQGNFLQHEYRITEGRRPIAEVSQRWFRIRDTYGIEVGAGVDDLLVLAVACAIDQMSGPGR
jgi:uncharacterized protein YxjI